VHCENNVRARTAAAPAAAAVGDRGARRCVYSPHSGVRARAAPEIRRRPFSPVCPDSLSISISLTHTLTLSLGLSPILGLFPPKSRSLLTPGHFSRSFALCRPLRRSVVAEESRGSLRLAASPAARLLGGGRCDSPKDARGRSSHAGGGGGGRDARRRGGRER
jgi:hypothetical protein